MGVTAQVTAAPLAVLWAALSAGAVTVTMRAGLWRFRPSWPGGPLAVATSASVVCEAAATAVSRSGPDSMRDVGGALHLLAYCALAMGLIGFLHRRVGRSGVVDVGVLTAGFALLWWTLPVTEPLDGITRGAFEQVVRGAYPLGGLLALASFVRLLSDRHIDRTWLRPVLMVGAIGMALSGLSSGLAGVPGFPGGAANWGLAGCYAAWGVAMLHPSIASSGRARLDGTLATRRRVVVLMVTCMAAPALLLFHALDVPVRHAPLGAAYAVLLSAIALLRLARLLRSYGTAASRGREVGEAGAALVAATESQDIAWVLQQAVRALRPSGAPLMAYLALPEPSRLWVLHGWDATSFRAGPHAAGSAVDRLLELARGGPSSVPLEEVAPLLTQDLPQGADAASLYPLLVEVAGVEPRLVGVVVVAGRDITLRDVHDQLAVLAAAATLALERITLSQEIARERSETYFRSLVQNASDGIVILDDENAVRYASPAAHTLLHTGAANGQLILDGIHPDDHAMAKETLARVRKSRHRNHRTAWRLVGRHGRTAEADVVCSDLRDEPAIQGLVLTVRDVTAQRRLERELTRRAFHDPLTGLANRALFDQRLREALARSEASGTVVAVLLADLDDFKVINDTTGHSVGDDLLVAVAARLSTLVRRGQTIARLGGDEFAVLVDDAVDIADVELLAERITDQFSAPLAIRGLALNAGLSVGLATSMDSGDAEELLQCADMALYAAKDAGKARWHRYEPRLRSQMVERRELQEAFVAALADNQFSLVYQPIVTLNGSGITGVEALLRWNHPSRGTVPPNQFIPIAEQTGFIVPLGAWVLEQACAQAAAWRRDFPRHSPSMSVNVSPAQFRAEGFIDTVQAALERSGLPAESLILELTEGLLIHDEQQVRDSIETLRQLGVQIAIDDFGTGYSSLSYLCTFPLDVLKVDKSFIDGLGADTRHTTLVEAIVRIARGLDLRLVAEGIDNPAHRDILADLGCPLGQGYLFSRPVPADQISHILDSQYLGGPAFLDLPVGVAALGQRRLRHAEAP